MSLGPGMTDSVPPWWWWWWLLHWQCVWVIVILKNSDIWQWFSAFIWQDLQQHELLSHRVLHMAVDFHSSKQEQEMHTWSHTNLDWLNTAQQVLRKQVKLMRRGPLDPDLDKNQWCGIDPMLRCQLSHWEGATQKMPDSGVKPKYDGNYLGIIIHRPSFSFLLATTFIIFSIRTY